MFDKPARCIIVEPRVGEPERPRPSHSSDIGALRVAMTRQLGALSRTAVGLGVDASTAVGTLLRMWCKRDYPALQTALPASRAFASSRQATAFVHRIRGLDFLEASYWLSTAYSRLSDPTYRKSLAMYFTPPSLTHGLLDDLVAQGVDFTKHSFLDPACGGAAFLAPIAQRMRRSLLEQGYSSGRILQHVKAHLSGYDVDPVLCELSRQFLRMVLHEEIAQTGYVPGFRVRKANSLSVLRRSFGTVDVVVCNPPYRKLDALEAQALLPAYHEVMEAQPNLYGVFIGLSIRLLRPGGMAALVTPTSFLSGQYFSKLRRFLATTARAEHIGMVSDREGVFVDVQQETALSVFRKARNSHSRGQQVRVSVVSGEGKYKAVGGCSLPTDGRVWAIPRAEEDLQLLRVAAAGCSHLVDYGYRVRIGGFVWTRDKRPTFATLNHARQRRATSAVPLVWGRDIKMDGSLNFVESRMEHEGHRFVDMGSLDHPSVVKQPSVVLQRVTSNEQPRRLVCAEVPAELLARYGGYVGENHVVVLEQTTPTPALTPSELSALLSCPEIDRYFRCISGATNVSAFELNQLALPKLDALLRELSHGAPLPAAVARLMSGEQLLRAASG